MGTIRSRDLGSHCRRAGAFPRDVDPRLDSIAPPRHLSSANIEEEPGHSRDRIWKALRCAPVRITPLSRQALLLTAWRASRRGRRYLIGAEAAEVESLVAEALGEIERHQGRRLIIEMSRSSRWISNDRP